MRIFLSIFFAITVVCLNAQQQKMKLMYGKVTDAFTHRGVEGVMVSTEDSSYLIKTKDFGAYELNIPRKTKWLNYNHHNYEPKHIRLKPSTRRLNVKMISYEPRIYDSPEGKNSLSFLPTKLLLGAIGLRYERFIKVRYSLGTYVDWYFAGRQFFGGEEYTALKVSPSIRYYIRRHKELGFYVQATAIVAYFDFAKLNYNNNYRSGDYISTTAIFWSGGFGAAIGIYFVKGRGNHFYLDINAGFQYLPANYPDEMPTSRRVYEHNKTWWYFGGPGSVIEIKFAIGGIF